MKKESIFDLYEAQHKDDPAPAADRIPGEVKPEDITPAAEVQAPEATEPKREAPEVKPEAPEVKQEAPEGGIENGT